MERLGRFFLRTRPTFSLIEALQTLTPPVRRIGLFEDEALSTQQGAIQLSLILPMTGGLDSKPPVLDVQICSKSVPTHQKSEELAKPTCLFPLNQKTGGHCAAVPPPGKRADRPSSHDPSRAVEVAEEAEVQSAWGQSMGCGAPVGGVKSEAVCALYVEVQMVQM